MTKYELRRWIPLKIQRFIRSKRFRTEYQRNEEFRQRILDYYKETEDDELLEVINYLKKNPLSFFCYEFLDYAYRKKIIVHYNKDCGMYYTVIDGRNLYFKRSMDANAAQNYMCSILCEQHGKSPHSYHMEELTRIEESLCVIDLGGAEGYFAFCNINNAEKIYIVECDPEWVEALEMTFAPWKGKVTIIPQAAGSATSDNEIRCSSLLQTDLKNIIKMDIEGMEIPVLKELAQSPKFRKCSGTRIIACTYHNADDEKLIKEIFFEEDMEIHVNGGYVFVAAEELGDCFRRGVAFIDKK